MRSAFIVSALVLLCSHPGQAVAADDRAHQKSPLSALSESIRELTRRVTPAVVEIMVVGYSTGDDSGGSTSNQISRQRSSGSGVIVDSEGYVMTNAHVVEGALTVKVMVPSPVSKDGTGPEVHVENAKILGVDRDSDLALLKIDAQNLSALPFGDSSTLSQGDLVLAIGSPMQLRNSLSMGVISAPARSVSDENPVLYIQTDASINPGDSGGALVDTEGRLVGLNTFIMSKSGGNEGIGFAIPANEVRNVYSQLRETGVVARGYIGVFAQNITSDLATGLDLPTRQGALVADVDPDGPGENAGLQRRDIILSANGAAIESARQLNNTVYQSKAGDKIALSVRRGARKLLIDVVAAARSAPTPSLAALVSPKKSLVARLGILCVELSGEAADLIPDLRRHYGLIVASKSPEGQAQFIDLRPGDVIHTINNLPVASLDVFRQKVESFLAGDSVALQIEREGRFQYVAFEIE
jgi:serine protease Do